MRNSRTRILSSAIVIIAVVCFVESVCAASIGQRHLELADFDTDKEQLHVRLQRQAYEPEDSVEDSDEDDDEDDVEQFQQSLVQQQSFQDSAERDEGDDEDDEGYERRRKRRDLIASENQQTLEPIMSAVQKPVELVIENMPVVEEEHKKQPEPSENKVETVPVVSPVEAVDKPQETSTESESSEGIIPTGSTTATPTRKTPVLILIRDALKKVTTGLPTEQVATNALQYFQLFEHFLQQAIEQVIGDDDDEDEEATTVKFEPEAEPELVNKIPEVETSQSTQIVEETINTSNGSDSDKNEQIKEPPKEAVMEPAKEIAMEPPKEAVMEPAKEVAMEPAKEIVMEPAKEPSFVNPPIENKPLEEPALASTPSNNASSMPSNEVALNVL